MRFTMDFSECESAENVHNKLLTHLCTEYLDADKCKANFEKFKMSCNNYLRTPAERNQANASDFCEKLKSKGHLGIGIYEEFRTLIKGIDVDIEGVIDRAEEKINRLLTESDGNSPTGNTKVQKDIPTTKRKTTRSYSDDNDQEPQLKAHCIVRTKPNSQSIFTDKSNVDEVAEEFLKFIMQDFETVQTYSCEADFFDSFDDLQDITFKLVEKYKIDFGESGEKGFEFGKIRVMCYLNILKKHFYSGKDNFKKFCEESLERLFISLSKSAKSYRNFLSHCNAHVGEVIKGSLICCHIFNTVIGLERFWKYYQYGELGRLLEDFMDIKELLSILVVDKIRITVNISEREYNESHRSLENRRKCDIPKEWRLPEMLQMSIRFKGEHSQERKEHLQMRQANERIVIEDPINTSNEEFITRVEQTKQDADLVRAEMVSTCTDPSDSIEEGRMTEHHGVPNVQHHEVVKRIEEIFGTSVIHFTDDKVWIYDDDKKSIGIYDVNFIRMKKIKLGFSLIDMAMYGLFGAIATVWDNKRIVRISNAGGITKVCSTAPLTPLGICVNNKQQIVVGLGKVVRRGEVHSKVVVYSSDGSSVLQVIKYDQSGGRLFKGGIFRVRQTISGEYVVADRGRIVCLGTEWNVKWEYRLELWNHVWALYCDWNNNILVGDTHNKKIVMLNKDGQLIATLLREYDGIKFPVSMDVDGKGRLWIGQMSDVLISTYIT